MTAGLTTIQSPRSRAPARPRWLTTFMGECRVWRLVMQPGGRSHDPAVRNQVHPSSPRSALGGHGQEARAFARRQGQQPHN
jgi:hypothetical protein